MPVPIFLRPRSTEWTACQVGAGGASQYVCRQGHDTHIELSPPYRSQPDTEHSQKHSAKVTARTAHRFSSVDARSKNSGGKAAQAARMLLLMSDGGSLDTRRQDCKQTGREDGLGEACNRQRLCTAMQVAAQ